MKNRGAALVLRFHFHGHDPVNEPPTTFLPFGFVSLLPLVLFFVVVVVPRQFPSDSTLLLLLLCFTFRDVSSPERRVPETQLNSQ